MSANAKQPKRATLREDNADLPRNGMRAATPKMLGAEVRGPPRSITVSFWGHGSSCCWMVFCTAARSTLASGLNSLLKFFGCSLGCLRSFDSWLSDIFLPGPIPLNSTKQRTKKKSNHKGILHIYYLFFTNTFLLGFFTKTKAEKQKWKTKYALFEGRKVLGSAVFFRFRLRRIVWNQRRRSLPRRRALAGALEWLRCYWISLGVLLCLCFYVWSLFSYLFFFVIILFCRIGFV